MNASNNSDLGQTELPANGYPAIRFLVRYGHALAVVIGAAAIGTGIVAAVSGWGWGWIPAGILGGGLVYLLFRSYAEIVQVIAETLLPR